MNPFSVDLTSPHLHYEPTNVQAGHPEDFKESVLDEDTKLSSIMQEGMQHTGFSKYSKLK